MSIMKMTTIEPSQNKWITVTDAAAAKLYELLLAEKNPLLKLRIFVMGGGCQGVQFGFSFEAEAAEDDTSFTRAVVTDQGKQLVTLLMDPMSLPYLQGAKMDLIDDASGERFVIQNAPMPHSCESCHGSCGSCGDTRA